MNRRRTLLFLLALSFLILCGISFVYFLDYHEARVDSSGILFHDPVFSWLPIFDCSGLIFTITYGSMLLYVGLNYKQNYFLTRLMFSYGILLLLRMLTLTLLPLKEPESLIYLQDPFLNNLIYPGHIDADLFFSGHTGLVFILFFLSKKKIFFVLGSILGLMLVLQRVHYSIDVIAAIPFAYLIVWSVELIQTRLINDD